MSSEPIDSARAGQRLLAPVSLSTRLRRLAWSAIQMTLYQGSFHTWSGFRATLLRSFGARVGKNCTIRRTSRVYYPWLFSMGDLSSLGDRTEVYNLGAIVIGDRVTISQEAYLCSGTHDYTKLEMPLVVQPISVESDVWVGARAFICPGITLRRGSVVGAGAVVTRDVDEWSIVGGNPAKMIKKRTLV